MFGENGCTFADVSTLTRNRHAGDVDEGDVARSPREHFRTYLRSLDVEREGLPDNVRETHVSLFDNSNCGIELIDRPAFSVQYHPEASPGPQDSFYLFERFVKQITKET